MPDAPRRIQRSRAKGWRMPEGAVYVGRPSRWGNPWTVSDIREEVGLLPMLAREAAAESFRAWLAAGGEDFGYPACPDRRRVILRDLKALRGRDLACFCRLDQPCHADVLLELANAPLRCEAVSNG